MNLIKTISSWTKLMILYELRFFLIIKKKVQELRHSVVTGSLTMSIEKKRVHKGLINLSNYLLIFLFLCISLKLSAQINIYSNYQTTYLREVYDKAQIEKDTATLGIAAYLIHENLKLELVRDPDGLDLITLSIKCFSSLKDSVHLFQARAKLLPYYFSTERFEELERVLLEDLAYYNRNNNELMKVHTSFSLARVYYALGENGKSNDYYTEAIKLNQNVRDTLISILALIAKVEIFQEQKQFDQAIEASNTALGLSLASNNQQRVDLCLFYLGLNNEYKHAYEIAISYFEKLRKHKKNETFSKLKLQSYKHLSQCYEQTKRYRKAQQFAVKYASLADSIWTKNRDEALETLTIKYETKEKQVAIDRLEQENTRQEKINTRKNEVLYGLSVVLFLLFVLLGLLIRFYRDKIEKDKVIISQAKKLSQQKIDGLEKEMQLMAIKSMLDGQEKERKRIALDLHDSLGGTLAIIKLKLNSSHLQVDDQVVKLLDKAANDVRSIAQNLQPNALQQLGLIPAVSDLINSNIRLDQPPIISFQYYNIPNEIESTIALQVYRIIQESLNNALKHAKAKEILIQITGEENGLCILIEDDGQGFNPKQIGNGQGLYNMKKRAEFLQAHLSIDSNEKGTIIFVSFVLNSK